jgi:ribonucleoside-diphosphate reductase beta chain
MEEAMLQLTKTESDKSWMASRYAQARAARWLPHAIVMEPDAALWRAADGLDAVERDAVQRSLGFLMCAGSLAGKDMVLGIYRHMSSRESRQILLHEAFEETLHLHSCVGISTALGIDLHGARAAFHAAPSVRAKDAFLMPFMATLADRAFKTGTIENDRRLLLSLTVYSCLLNGVMFHGGLVPVLAMGMRGKMTGMAEHCRHILADQSRHGDVGIDLVHTLRREKPQLWNARFAVWVEELFRQAVELECRYVDDTAPNGIAGIEANQLKRYLRYVASRRARQLGLGDLFGVPSNPLPWMDELLASPEM